MRQLNTGWIAALILGFVCTTLACHPAPPEIKDLKPRPAEIGVRTQDTEIQNEKYQRHHYEFSLPKEGLVRVSLNWQDPDGIDRMIIHGGGGMSDTVLSRDKLSAVFTKQVYRGRYYIEIVPGSYATTYNLLVEMVEPGITYSTGNCDNLEPIYFDYNEHTLSSSAQATLRNHASCLDSRRASLQIDGHCDEHGSEGHNNALGLRRASSAKAYLNTLGVSESRLSTNTFGESDPATSGSDEYARAKNRRCEFRWR